MSRRSWALDLAIAACVVVLGQLEAWSGVGATHRVGPHWAEAAVYAVAGGLLVFRRTRPLLALVAIDVAMVIEFAVFGAPEGAGLTLAPLIAVYSVARWEHRYRPVWGLAVGLCFGAAWIALDPVQETWAQRAGGLFWVSPTVIAWLVGALVRATLQTRDQRRLRAEDSRTRAVAEERNRIARELHDVIGHSVSVMTVQAAAVRRRLAPEQGTEREALETVERSGREALAEMRRMVQVLRAEGQASELAPAPGLSDIGPLVERFRTAGLPVTVQVSGDPRPLAGGLDLTAYRLVQEGLTNVLRHANHPERAEVVITYTDDAVRLEVGDDGRPVLGETAPGHGLLGMQERVSVYGGRLAARARQGGGFELVAELPLVVP